jgi:hypothetical protein
MYHFPKVMELSFREDLRSISWRNDAGDFSAWCEGRTGYPIVDASMRQLLTTGWMHNRGRMIVASFLVKDLVIDWRWGERFFLQQLFDGDPASNKAGSGQQAPGQMQPHISGYSTRPCKVRSLILKVFLSADGFRNYQRFQRDTSTLPGKWRKACRSNTAASLARITLSQS